MVYYINVTQKSTSCNWTPTLADILMITPPKLSKVVKVYTVYITGTSAKELLANIK